MLVCQHLFNCQMKQQQKIICANVYWNTIKDGDSQMSLLPIFSKGIKGVICTQASTELLFYFFYHHHGRHGCLSFLLSLSNRAVSCFMMEIFY